MPKKTATDSGNIDFEQALRELETLVERMEQGEGSLEQSLRDFEQGIALTRRCQQALQQAEQKVSILLSKDADAPLQDFDPDAK
jgi:exodeoxyribonuclease VII small subunit